MSTSPIRKAAGQSVEEMTAQLAGSKEGNRLYTPKAGTYNEALDAAIDHQLELLAAAKRRGRVNLNDVDEVEATATAYMTSCKRAGVYPTMLGFAAACGYSRKAIYEYIARHNGKTVDYLDGLRSSWAAIVAHMGLTRKCLYLPAEKLWAGHGRPGRNRHCTQNRKSSGRDQRPGGIAPEVLGRCLWGRCRKDSGSRGQGGLKNLLEILGVFKPLNEATPESTFPPPPAYMQAVRPLIQGMPPKLAVFCPLTCIQESRLWTNRRRLLLFGVLEDFGQDHQREKQNYK